MKRSLLKPFLTCLLLIVTGAFTQKAAAQDVEFTNHTVLIDGKPCMKISSGDPNNIVFSSMEDEELIILKFARPTGKLYTEVMFVREGKSLTSRTYIFTKKNLINNLVKSNVLKDCTLVGKKLDIFILKYDEQIER